MESSMKREQFFLNRWHLPNLPSCQLKKRRLYLVEGPAVTSCYLDTSVLRYSRFECNIIGLTLSRWVYIHSAIQVCASTNGTHSMSCSSRWFSMLIVCGLSTSEMVLGNWSGVNGCAGYISVAGILYDGTNNAQVDSTACWASGCYSRCKSMERDHDDGGLDANWTVGGKSRVPWLEEMFRCCLLAVLSQYIFFSFILTHKFSYRYRTRQHRNPSHNAHTPKQCVTILTKQRNPTLRYSIFVVNMGFHPEPTLFVFTYYGILPATSQRLEKQY